MHFWATVVVGAGPCDPSLVNQNGSMRPAPCAYHIMQPLMLMVCHQAQFSHEVLQTLYQSIVEKPFNYAAHKTRSVGHVGGVQFTAVRYR